MSFDYILNRYIIPYGISLGIAILIYLIGKMVIPIVLTVVDKLLSKSGVEETLKKFVKSIIKSLLYIILIIAILSKLGVDTSSFVAILGAITFAIGFALKDSLSNFAAGAMIIIFKPFKVGDFIEAQGYAGFVKEIQIFNTLLKTPDNKIAIIPNGGLSTGSTLNYSTMNTRRVDFTFGIGYGDDIDKAKEVIAKVANEYDLVLKSPEPFIAVSELADSSVNFTVRVWTKTDNYWDVYFYMFEKVKKGFDEAEVSIPFPQRDIHVHNAN